MKIIKSPLLVKIIILVLVVYATVTLVSLRAQINDKNAQAAATAQQITQTKQENARIEDADKALETDEGVEAVAREKLGMVSENEIIFQDVGG